jgi:effector-binding domain-containing protein
MVVDFRLKRVPQLRVATVAWKGPWSERRIRAQFDRVAEWARKKGVRTGQWIFREPGTRSWEVAIEIKGSAHSEGGVRVRTYPAATVASVVFDPEVVSPAVVYHGISDWLRWRRKDKTIRSVGTYREVYSGDPWRRANAWARTDVQVVVRK